MNLVPANHPALITPAKKVVDFADPFLGTLEAGLIKVLKDTQAYAVAAPQVGVSLEMIVLSPLVSIPNQQTGLLR